MALFVLQSCKIITEDANLVPAVVIKSQLAQGVTKSNKNFMVKNAFCKSKILFNENGYMFSLYDVDAKCDNPTFAPIDFFIKKLEVGTYSGSGPYFFTSSGNGNSSSTSYIGCDVIITKVTATTVEGKVKGGDLSQDQFIEGSFTATICK